MAGSMVSEPEPGYLAGAGAVTFARLRLQLQLLHNSRKLNFGVKNKLVTSVTTVQ